MGHYARLTGPLLSREVAKQYKRHLTPLKDKDSTVTLVAPKIRAANWADWKEEDDLVEFLNRCKDCKIGSIAVDIHWDDHWSDIKPLENVIDRIYAKFKKPIFILGFYPAGNLTDYQLRDDVYAFYSDAVAYLDSNKNVAGYAVRRLSPCALHSFAFFG